MRDLRGVPFARRYLAGQSLSILGDTSLWLALAIWVRELTGSNAQAGLTFFFLAVPSLFGPLWGTVVDRFHRRPILIGVNAVAGVMTLSLIAVHGRGQARHGDRSGRRDAGSATLAVPILGVDIIGAVLAGFGLPWFSAASSTMLQRLTPSHLQGRVSSTVDVIVGTPQSMSIALGAGLLAVFGYQALLVVVAVVIGGAGLWLFTRPEQRLALVSGPAASVVPTLGRIAIEPDIVASRDSADPPAPSR